LFGNGHDRAALDGPQVATTVNDWTTDMLLQFFTPEQLSSRRHG
jgi:hypothetical protein